MINPIKIISDQQSALTDDKVRALFSPLSHAVGVTAPPEGEPLAGRATFA
jgi:hypothetical protein